jgi:hypothetical protein
MPTSLLVDSIAQPPIPTIPPEPVIRSHPTPVHLSRVLAIHSKLRIEEVEGVLESECALACNDCLAFMMGLLLP